jgi:hypothetical protein
MGQHNACVYAQKFHLSGHLAQLEIDISVHDLTSASATAAHVFANPSKTARQ